VPTGRTSVWQMGRTEAGRVHTWMREKHARVDGEDEGLAVVDRAGARMPHWEARG
jgi:hypothetical protein